MERELTRERDDEEPRVSDVVKLKPTYDLKKVSAQLKDPKLPKERKKKLLLGMHEQFWHATADRLHIMLEKAGMPKEVLQLIREVIPTIALDANSSLMRSIGQG